LAKHTVHSSEITAILCTQPNGQMFLFFVIFVLRVRFL